MFPKRYWAQPYYPARYWEVGAGVIPPIPPPPIVVVGGGGASKKYQYREPVRALRDQLEHFRRQRELARIREREKIRKAQVDDEEIMLLLMRDE